MEIIEIISSNNIDYDIFINASMLGDAFVNDNEKIIFDKIGTSYSTITIYLHKVSYMSSSGLALLVKILTKTSLQQGKVYLKGVNEPIIYLLKITKLIDVFTIIS